MGNVPTKTTSKKSCSPSSSHQETFHINVEVKDENNKVIDTYPKSKVLAFLECKQFKQELTSIFNMSSGVRGNFTHDFAIQITKLQVTKKNGTFSLKVVCDVRKRPHRKSTCLDVAELKHHVAFALKETSYRGSIPAKEGIDGKYWLVLRVPA